MFHTVVLEPGGRSFEVRRGESILQAGLRAGVSLRYSCTNGTCGDCSARLLAGDVERIQHHDFCFSAAQAAQGNLLMCCNTAHTDLRLAATELGAVEDIPEQLITAKISRVDHPSENYAIAHLRTPRSRTLQFLAGQEVQVNIAGGPACRLPLANCPCDGLRPQFHVRRMPGDARSEQLFTALRSGAACELRGPVGDFVLGSHQPDTPLLFIAYETGFAPVYSLLEHVIALDWQAPLRLIWLADDARGLYLENYCRSLQDALDDFQFHTAEVGNAPRFGEVLQRSLARLPELPDCAVYAVPPPGEVAATQSLLQQAGAAPQRLSVAGLQML